MYDLDKDSLLKSNLQSFGLINDINVTKLREHKACILRKDNKYKLYIKTLNTKYWSTFESNSFKTIRLNEKQKALEYLRI